MARGAFQAYGDAGSGVLPLGSNTVFKIGSITKVVTGILLTDMGREGLVSIEDPLQRHVPNGITFVFRRSLPVCSRCLLKGSSSTNCSSRTYGADCIRRKAANSRRRVRSSTPARAIAV